MLISPTLDKLQALSLGGMARAFEEQLESPGYQELTFEERLGLAPNLRQQGVESHRKENSQSQEDEVTTRDVAGVCGAAKQAGSSTKP